MEPRLFFWLHYQHMRQDPPLTATVLSVILFAACSSVPESLSAPGSGTTGSGAAPCANRSPLPTYMLISLS